MLAVWVKSRCCLGVCVDGANIGEFDSHRCLRRLNVHACEEKYIERRKKSTLNAEVRRRSLSAARISSMYGRFGGLTGDISLTYGRHMRRKPQKKYPRSNCFRRRRTIYKRETSGQEAKSAIHNADRPVGVGVLREVISREYTLRPTAGERCVVLRLSFVLATERGMSRMVPRWVVLR